MIYISYAMIQNMEILYLKNMSENIISIIQPALYLQSNFSTGGKAYFNNSGPHFMLYKYSTINCNS